MKRSRVSPCRVRQKIFRYLKLLQYSPHTSSAPQKCCIAMLTADVVSEVVSPMTEMK